MFVGPFLSIVSVFNTISPKIGATFKSPSKTPTIAAQVGANSTEISIRPAGPSSSSSFPFIDNGLGMCHGRPLASPSSVYLSDRFSCSTVCCSTLCFSAARSRGERQARWGPTFGGPCFRRVEEKSGCRISPSCQRCESEVARRSRREL